MGQEITYSAYYIQTLRDYNSDILLATSRNVCIKQTPSELAKWHAHKPQAFIVLIVCTGEVYNQLIHHNTLFFISLKCYILVVLNSFCFLSGLPDGMLQVYNIVLIVQVFLVTNSWIEANMESL